MTAPVIPPITDRLPIALRAFAAPTWRTLPDDDDSSEDSAEARDRPILATSPWTLAFDTETTTHPGQALRFGTYQLRNAGELIETGIFYDPAIAADEIETLRRYAEREGLPLRTREEFVDDVFFGRAYQWRATIIGFNLPFDISRLAIKHGTARNPLEAEKTTMRGAFTFKLSDQKIYPNIRVKHLSQKASLISFAATMGQRAPRGQRKRDLPVPVRRGHFLDVGTLANALFARGFSLASLSEFLKVDHRKLEFDDFDAPVSDEMIRYAIGDVQATWDCYVELSARLDRLNLSRTIPEKVYSEASIGKGYLKEMGVAPWRDVQADFPRDLLAKIMGSYFGGRSEVRIHREMRQVILCDFLSMYPTVCTLMGLWQFVIATGMTWRDATAETRGLLETVDLSELQSQPIWARLSTLVRVLPDGDIFPVRAAYADEPQTTIGANHLSSDCPLWFTLADCIAAKLLTGKTPAIVEAITFGPGPVQSGLRPIDVSGNAAYHVDPNATDFFKRVIELRQSIKKRRDKAPAGDRAALDTEQNALKIAANATSYGVYVEVNVDTRPVRKSTTVHSSTCEPFSFTTDKAEMPGTYFHPLLATLITGAARLMLAIAERLATDQGLEWAFCDTDSMAIAKPDAMLPDDFAKRAGAVVDWFAALNPYEFDGSILQVERVNGSLETGEPEPLYCWAVSSKRYALFNLAPDGRPIMRKVSAHGLGHLRPPYEADAASANIPTPDASVLGKGIERWHSDLWWQIVCAAIDGHADKVQRDYHPALGDAAISRYSATTPELLQWFSTFNDRRDYRDQVKPFGFLFSLSAKLDFGGEQIAWRRGPGRPKKARPIKPTAPFDRDHAKAIALAFDRETGEPVPSSALKSYADALAHYHIQPESKFLNADYHDHGTTLRRHVMMTGTNHIGKESHDWERQALLGLNLDSEIAYGVATDDVADKLRSFIIEFGERTAAKALGISAPQLMALVADSPNLLSERLAQKVVSRLPAALRLCAKLSHDRNVELHRLREAVEREGLRGTARRLGIDPSNLRRRLNLSSFR